MASLNAALLILAFAACCAADQAADVDQQLESLVQVGRKTMESWSNEAPDKVQSEYDSIFEHGPAVLPDKKATLPPPVFHNTPSRSEVAMKYAAEQKKIAENKVRKLALKRQQALEMNKGIALAKQILGGKAVKKHFGSDMKVPEMPPHVPTPQEVKDAKARKLNEGLSLAKKLLKPPAPNKEHVDGPHVAQPPVAQPPSAKPAPHKETKAITVPRNVPMTATANLPMTAVKQQRVAKVVPQPAVSLGSGVQIMPRHDTIDENGARTIPPTIHLPGLPQVTLQDRLKMVDATKAKADARAKALKAKREHEAAAAEARRVTAMSDEQWAADVHEHVLANPVFKEARMYGMLDDKPVHYNDDDGDDDDNDDDAGIVNVLKEGGMDGVVKENYRGLNDWQLSDD